MAIIFKRKNSKGFTLVELLVVMGIMVVVSTLMFTNNSRFGGVVFLENLAYDIALSLRKAQVYGIAVRRYGTDDFSAGYGVQFVLNDPKRYILFADGVNPNGIFDCPDPENNVCEAIEESEIQGGYHIYDLCAVPSGGTKECGLSKLNILFKRPEPDAYIRVVGDSPILYERAEIVLQSPRLDLISVVVEITGQIAVQK